MKTIQTLFPDQESINDALSKLSPEDRARYDVLLLQYQKLIAEDTPEHEKIAVVMAEATKILTR